MGIEHLLTASPQVEAIKAEPYSVDEIDQLLNAARVWATVVALRDHMRGEAVADVLVELEELIETILEDE